MKPGGVAEPVRLAKGWQIIKLETAPRRPSCCRSIRRATRSRTSVFINKRGAELERRTVKTLRAQAAIEWKNDELKKAYDQALAAETEELAQPPVAATSKPGN